MNSWDRPRAAARPVAGTPSFWLLAVLSFALSDHLRAQNPGAVQHLQTVRQQQELGTALQDSAGRLVAPPQLYPAEESDVGPQSIIRLKPRRTYVELLGDSQYFYNDNMFLQENLPGSPTVATGELVNSVQLALTPGPYEVAGGKLSTRAGYRQQWFNFGLEQGAGTLSGFDFTAGAALVEARWYWKEKWILDAGFEWVRLLSTTDYREFYRDYTPRIGLTRVWPVSDSAAFVTAGQTAFRFTRTAPLPTRDVNDRLENTVLVSFNQLFLKRFLAQPYYRIQYSHYTRNHDRDDLLHSVGVAATWFLHPQVSLRAFVGYDLKESDDPIVPDYRSLNAGAGLGLAFRF